MTDLFLYSGEATPSDVRLSDPTVVRGGAVVPTQWYPFFADVLPAWAIWEAVASGVGAGDNVA